MKPTLLIAALLTALPAAALAQSPAEALDRLDRQLAETPNDAGLLADRGRLHFLLGDYDAAAADLWNATQTDPSLRQDAALQIMRGRAVLESGKAEAAAKVFETVQGGEGERARAAFYAAEAYASMGETALARAALKRAVALDPGYTAAQMRLDRLADGAAPEAAAEAGAMEEAEAPLLAEDEAEPVLEEAAAPSRAGARADLTPEEADALLDPDAPSSSTREAEETLLGLRGDEDALDAPEDAEAAPSEAGQEDEADSQGETRIETDEDGPVSLADADAGDAEAEAGDADGAADPGSGETMDEAGSGLEADEGEDAGDSGAEDAEARAVASLETLRAAASDAPVVDLRERISEARDAENTALELQTLRDLYIREAATPAEISRLAELTGLMTSQDAAADFRLARLAESARHTRLAAALYRGVDQSGVFEGRNLAIVRGNLATQLRALGNYPAALEAAEAALQADESYANAWAVKGLILRDQGKAGEALPVMKKAYERGARAPELLDRLRQAGMAVDSAPARSAQ